MLGPNFFDLDVLVLPMHVNGDHWICVAVHMQRKILECYDSFGVDRCVSHLEPVLRFIDHCYRFRFPHPTRPAMLPGAFTSDWNLVDCAHQKKMPQQLNGFDCGVFTCLAARNIGMNKVMDFDQAQITDHNYRDRLALCLLGEDVEL